MSMTVYNVEVRFWMTKLDDPCEHLAKLETDSAALLETAERTAKELEAYYPGLPNRREDPEAAQAVQEQINSLKQSAKHLRSAYLRAYEMSDELDARWHDLNPKKRRFIPNPPANSLIDSTEVASNHFAKGLNLYKLLLICFVGSFAGVAIELLWCLVTNGYLESRSGLVYGPFNLLYGAGAVVLTVCLYRFRNRGSWLSFLGGFVVGSAVEYVCSWGQEMLFGSRSWDYSHMPFNINGRICLLYSVFWGFLGVLWIKELYPWMAQWILKIPDKIGKVVTWILVVFFVFNAFMSFTSVVRWSQRVDGIAPSNGFWEFIDQRFPDERMESIYANMEFGD